MMLKKITLAVTCLMLALCAKSSAQSKAPTDGFNIKQYGAIADNKTDNAIAIQKAIDACSAAGGGRVIIPAAGVFVSGPFKLRSFVDLHVENGAKLLASSNEKLYTESAFRANKGEGTIWIGGENLQQVTISGGGTIDGNGIAFMGKELNDSYELKPFDNVDPRPHLLTLINCKQLRIQGVKVQNSAYWTIHLIGCNDVAISDITLLNSVKVRNSDGIDLDHSKNVRINNCYIESGDDCICLKNRREYQEYGACENITVSNCIMTSSSCALKIGSENMDRISNIVVTNCIIKNSNRGLGIQNRDEGTVNDVIFSNIVIESHFFSDVWWGKSEPIYITAYRRANANNKDAGWRLPPGQKEGKVGAVSRIYFDNIKCRSENGAYISAESADMISDIHFDQVDIQISKSTAFEGGVNDRRPSNAEGLVKANTAGIYLDKAANVFLNNCTISWGTNLAPYFVHGIEGHGVEQLKMSGINAVPAFKDKADAIKIYK